MVFEADRRVKIFLPVNIIALMFEIVLSATTVEEPWWMDVVKLRIRIP